MLNAEHVRAKRDGTRLLVQELSARQRARALEIAEQLLVAASSCVSLTRDDLMRALALVELSARERKLGEGLKKLIEDACEFEQGAAADPAALRSDVFLRAAAARREATLEQPFSRDAVLQQSASDLRLSAAELDEALYSDLRALHRLVRVPTYDPDALVCAYEHGQIQAVLLRAVQVVADVRCASAEAYRHVFQKLKFRQLLYRLERLEDGGYRIHVDGPFSLFEAGTRYGLELSLMLPVLQSCDVLELSAEVLWGKSRARLRYEHRHVAPRAALGEAAALPDQVALLLAEFALLDSPWQPRVAEHILELPGVGLCVPDLVFEHAAGGPPVYLELLGFWSRDAVWRRVELCEAGLAERVVFAVSARLRVSEAVLAENDHAALYVYRGKPSARAVERKLEALRAQAPARRPR
jgi:hypothetical protein